MSLQLNWTNELTIRNNADVKQLINLYKSVKPDYGSLDTESDGLHIINNRPFLISFGFANRLFKLGFTCTIDLEEFKGVACNTKYGHLAEFFNVLYTLFKPMKKIVFWNAKYDLHMLTNIGFPYLEDNITDGMIYARLAHDAVSSKFGGLDLSLKGYATKFIDTNARHLESKLKLQRKQIKATQTRKLKTALQEYGQPPEEFRVANEKSWTMKTIETFFKDPVNEIDDLPYGVRQVVRSWLFARIDPDNYRNYNRSDVAKYAHYDIIYTLEAFFQCEPVALNRKQHQTIKLEEDLILPLYRMERVGFKFDMDYAKQAKEKVKAYIIRLRNRLVELAGQPVKSGQSKLIAEILKLRFGLYVKSTGKDALSQINYDNIKSYREVNAPESYETIITRDGKDYYANYVKDQWGQILFSGSGDEYEIIKEVEKVEYHPTHKEDCKSFIETLQTLRTLEKWFSTYIVRWINDAKDDERVYTTIHQVGTASGRVSSNFQQFPKDPILDEDGNELFHPRKMFTVSRGGYDKIFYIDYSQMEVRILALYTLMLAGGDTNLCRAYIPHKCIQKDGKWYLEEDHSIEWQDVDMHTNTTKKAFPHLEVGSKEFLKMRKVGKSANFAIIYGASVDTLIAQFGFDKELATTLYNAFYEAFPKVRDYQKYVRDSLYKLGYAENLMGRKYYGASAHNCNNYLIQGSGADMLKSKIIEVDKYILDNNLKTRLQMNIHDEISCEGWQGEEEHIMLITEIAEDFKSPIPMDADAEITYTNWAEKDDYVAQCN